MSLRTFLLGGYWSVPGVDPAVIDTARGALAVRPVTAADADLARSFVERLSSESRRYRFFQSFCTVPPSLVNRFVSVDAISHCALVAVASTAGAPRIVGEARYCRNADGREAEIAIAVDDDWQGLGVGRGLLERLEARASGNGVHHLKGEVLAANDRMLQFVRNRGFSIMPDADDRQLLHIAKTLVG